LDFGPYLLLATLEGAVGAAVLALTALGLSLVFGVMRIVNVAHGAFFMLGAIIAWWVADTLGAGSAINFFAALVISPLVVGAVALASERLVLRRLNYNPESTIVATIGLLYVIEQVALMTYGPDARPVEAPWDFRVQLPWFGYSAYKFMVIGASILVMLAVWWGLTRTRVGLMMRATQFDSETARAFAIPVDRVYSGVFALGAMLAAVGAVLVVPIQQAHYLMGGDPLLLSFIVVIIGGLGSLRGTVLAAIIIGLSDGIISVFFTPTLAKIIATLMVALILVIRPKGLFGGSSS